MRRPLPHRQQGQALVEFTVVSLFVLVPLFLIVPVVARVISQQQDVELAARYAAKARPWYARPTDLQQFARHDGNFEYGNLYNPFWQPRLVALSDLEKAALALAAGLSDL